MARKTKDNVLIDLTKALGFLALMALGVFVGLNYTLYVVTLLRAVNADSNYFAWVIGNAMAFYMFLYFMMHWAFDLLGGKK